MAEQVVHSLLVPAVQELQSLYALYNGYLPPAVRPYTSHILGATFVVGNLLVKGVLSRKRKRVAGDDACKGDVDTSAKKKVKSGPTCVESTKCNEVAGKLEANEEVAKEAVTLQNDAKRADEHSQDEVPGSVLSSQSLKEPSKCDPQEPQPPAHIAKVVEPERRVSSRQLSRFCLVIHHYLLGRGGGQHV